MKTPQTNYPLDLDDCDDIFGPPRSYHTAYPPRNRPSMISAKYKQKEERRKVLKISQNKLRKIDDPEVNLCRSVLINNTMKRLQQETKEEKSQKQQLNYPRCNNSYFNIKTEFLRSDNVKPAAEEDVVIENDFHAKLEEEIKHANEAKPQTNDVTQTKKRSFEELVEDCDMHEVLSQLYMPPASRMLSGLDDNDDVTTEDPLSKRLKMEESDASPVASHSTNSYASGVPSFVVNNNRFSDADSNGFRCGQVSMMSEMQNSIYHSFIASLET